MKRRFVFATGNRHKLEEARAILGGRVEIVSPADLGYAGDIPEEQETLEGNALQKARHVHGLFGADCFADDTGLEVAALGNAPGVRSARYAGESRDPLANTRKVLRLMEGVTRREARFRCVIALILDGKEYLFEGIVEGEILERPAGDGGFGYDPVFRPRGHEESFALMPASLKNEISHRGRALRALERFLCREEERWRS
ncbi:MAG: RdgB/HAM1 family non-canonical purine NTP pyrophosphatase [Odoribacteraceae bacterium]|jgi:XTP/dITP diphosphohydrolase|nr:RdgB/HAM1 family non-canonical purine NTP pyrophosphatase [Odoribacteraceae bacterium]